MAGGNRILFIICCSLLVAVCGQQLAFADLVSKAYLDKIVSRLDVQSDWDLADPEDPGFIKNKPNLRSPDTIELLENKVDSLDGALKPEQYPNAQIVKSELDKKLDKNSAVLDSIPSEKPEGLPPEGRVFIWFN